MADADLHSDSESTTSDPLDTHHDEGWEDVEPDHETSTFVSLFDDKVFGHVNQMLEYCHSSYSFNLRKVQKELDLDFLGIVRLVNYVRSEVKKGNQKPDTSSRILFEDEIYLKPVLEDDALLYSIDDIEEEEDAPKPNGALPAAAQIEELRNELLQLQSQFAAYREEVQKTLFRQLDEDLTISAGPSSRRSAEGINETAQSKTEKKDEIEAGYFSSYSYNTIHEFMLKDTVRTDAYRDFIYDNKHLFAGKVVLDVGCGTGILSMFCAKAGAKKVIAVDNSDIIDKARQIIFENGFQDTIQCLRGKIEEVTLPVAKVDVIVSEWMGYCLLYESMLDSVLYARDQYLQSDGLMVPSHANLRIAPLADSDLVVSHVDFWKSVYNFKMSGMLEKVFDEALIRSVEPEDIPANSVAFLELDLHAAKTTDLTFIKPFEISWKKDFGRLEGFVVWFDIYFMRSRSERLTKDLTTDQAIEKGIVAFTTGPNAKQTHWQQGALLIKEPGAALHEGETLTGTIGYQRMEGQDRSLDIEVRWNCPSAAGRCRQVWSLN